MTPVSYIQVHDEIRGSRRGENVAQLPERNNQNLLEVARIFVAARRSCELLSDYPGALPGDLDSAYQIQDHAIAMWPDRVAGWKVGWVPAEFQTLYGEERLVGPVFHGGVRAAPLGVEVPFPVFVGGFAAVEAEFVLCLGHDAPAGKIDWTPEEAAEVVASLHIGIEPASSPLATINEIGPVAVVSDFGNNAGLLLGPAVPDWRRRLAQQIACETFIEGTSVGRGGTARLPRGPLGALAFALNRCAKRGRPLRAGDMITTGAASGIHDIRPGQSASVVFDGIGELRCRAEPARPAAGPGGEPPLRSAC